MSGSLPLPGLCGGRYVSPASCMLLLLGVCCAVGESDVQSQVPEIVPMGGKFDREVKVRIFSNEERGNVRIFYTVSKCCCTCECVEDPKPDQAGIEKPSRELETLARPILVSEPVTCVSAVAVTQGSKPSEFVRSEYRVDADSLKASPSISPKRGKYSGFVVVSIAKKSGLPLGSSEKFMYTIDGDDPTPEKGTQYTGPFKITAVGLHTVKAVLVSGGAASMHAYRDLQVVLPLAYELDPPQPVQGRPLTVMLQGVAPSVVTKVFLSTADCSQPHMQLQHELRGCDCPEGRHPVKPMLALTFRPIDSPTPNVYVCVTRNGGQTWVKAKRALTGNYTFALAPMAGASLEGGGGTGEELEQGELVEDAPPMDYERLLKHAAAQSRRSSTDDSWAIEPFVVIIVILGVGLLFFFKRAV
eukprot:TRINITY_DN36054_c0_g1_i1.p1 TRINITY_DN36054_c0_g1~~TRINITY_DN36054_c0_g1_i1.p1  ORF type:complete len:415 (+),score=155.96 TRINITY_DN36054_c0_g1_i1:115-1359(+)